MFKDFTGADKVYIACGYTDIRKGIDGFATLVQSEFKLTEVTHIGCFAHLRRKLFEAMDASCDNTVAKKGFDYCEALFAIEKELEDMTPDERYEARKEHSVPILNEFKQWADVQRVPAKSKTGKALTYLDNQWKYLKNYTLDGRLEISNNLAEISIKPFVIGRKNFLFSNTLNGVQSTAVTMSIIETAKANGLNPYKYLMWIFKTAPTIKTDADDKSWLYCCYRKNLRNNFKRETQWTAEQGSPL